MREILFEQMDAPSVRAVELQIDVPLPEGFDAWFSKCLDRDATKRFPTANEAWEALVPVLGAELRAPATLAALRTASMTTDERAKLETAPTAANFEMAATAPMGGLSGMEATVDASKLAAVAASAHSTNLNVGQTVPHAAAPRSNLRMVGAFVAAALVGIVSWQVASSRAEHKQMAMQEMHRPESLPEVLPLPDLNKGPLTVPSAVFPETPIPPSSTGVALPEPPNPPTVPKVPVPPNVPGALKSTASASPKLGPFDATRAQRAADILSTNVKRICGRLPGSGPRAFSVTITFDPSGRASKATANVRMASPQSTCAQSVLEGTVAAPYDPAFGMGRVVTAVVLD